MNATQGLLIDCNVLTEAQILALYQNAYQLLLQGKTYMTFEGEGNTLQAKFPIPVEQVLSECRYALRQVNSARWGHNTTAVQPICV